jgi:hypothetical protein
MKIEDLELSLFAFSLLFAALLDTDMRIVQKKPQDLKERQ